MIVDKETFTEMAVHLKLASDSVLTTARGLSIVQGQHENESGWTQTLDGLMAVNHEIAFMERILRALLMANLEEDGKASSSAH